MNKQYVYMGHEGVGAILQVRLERAGWERVGEVSAACAVITYCTSQTALEDAYFDEEGIVQTALPQTLLVDLSAATPSFARELSAVAMVSDLVSIEAPLVVSDAIRADALAQRDNMKCLVAGEQADIEAARPLLDAIVGGVEVTGGSGSAQLVRATYTLQAAAQIMAAIEADALFKASQGAATLGSLAGCASATTTEAQRVLAAIEANSFEGTYTVEMLMAELSAALMAADDVDLILPQAEACLHLLELLAVIGGVNKAPTALALVYGEEALCAENGLDWTRAEQAYGIDDDDDDYEDDSDQGEYPAGFGAYSAN